MSRRRLKVFLEFLDLLQHEIEKISKFVCQNNLINDLVSLVSQRSLSVFDLICDSSGY